MAAGITVNTNSRVCGAGEFLVEVQVLSAWNHDFGLAGLAEHLRKSAEEYVKQSLSSR